MDYAIEDNKLKVTKEVTNQEVQTFSYGDLIKQKEAIQKSLDDFTTARNTEIDEVNSLIAKCVELGLAE
jgi:hypothetical protein